MKTTQQNEELGQKITNDVIEDADGNVISEDITCESVRVPVLRLADNDDDYSPHTCEGFIPVSA